MKVQKFSGLIMKSKGLKRTAFFISALFFSLSAVGAADFWETKDYTKWNEGECNKLLTDSPWAQKLELMKTTGRLGDSEGAGGQSYIQYTIRLLSALPIREAQVRQAQIANKYDKLSPEQKQAFDKQTESFLAADYGDKVVVSISYSTNVQSLYQEITRFWQSQTTESFSNSVYLVRGKGEKAKLLDYRPPQGASQNFVFVFPREVNGSPLLSDQDKSLILEFIYPVVGGIGDAISAGKNEGKGFIEFKVKKMMIKGGVIY